MKCKGNKDKKFPEGLMYIGQKCTARNYFLSTNLHPLCDEAKILSKTNIFSGPNPKDFSETKFYETDNEMLKKQRQFSIVFGGLFVGFSIFQCENINN